MAKTSSKKGSKSFAKAGTPTKWTYEGMTKKTGQKPKIRSDPYKNMSQTSRPGPAPAGVSPMMVDAPGPRRAAPRGKTKYSCDAYTPPVSAKRDPCTERYAKTNLNVVCNPWFPTEQPKYPDGKAQWSIGRKFRFGEEVRPFDYGNCLIMLFPGMNNFAFAVSRNADRPDKGTEQMFVISNHTAEAGIAMITSVENNQDNTQRKYTLTPIERSYESWRPVSVGMRLKSLNTDDNDEGWWEAIRTSRDKIFKDTGYVVRDVLPGGATPTNPSKKVYPGNILPSLKNLKRDLTEADADWMNVPSYCTGRLTHLQFYDFQLNMIREDNDFIPIRPVETITKTEDLAKKVQPFYEYPNKDNPIDDMKVAVDSRDAATRAHEYTEAKEVLLAESMDVIMVRIHGTKNTKLFMETVMNQEVLVPQEGSYSSYQTPTMAKRDVLKKIITIRNKKYLLPYQRTRRM